MINKAVAKKTRRPKKLKMPETEGFTLSSGSITPLPASLPSSPSPPRCPRCQGRGRMPETRLRYPSGQETCQRKFNIIPKSVISAG